MHDAALNACRDLPPLPAAWPPRSAPSSWPSRAGCIRSVTARARAVRRNGRTSSEPTYAESFIFRGCDGRRSSVLGVLRVSPPAPPQVNTPPDVNTDPRQQVQLSAPDQQAQDHFKAKTTTPASPQDLLFWRIRVSVNRNSDTPWEFQQDSTRARALAAGFARVEPVVARCTHARQWAKPRLTGLRNKARTRRADTAQSVLLA